MGLLPNEPACRTCTDCCFTRPGLSCCCPEVVRACRHNSRERKQPQDRGQPHSMTAKKPERGLAVCCLFSSTSSVTNAERCCCCAGEFVMVLNARPASEPPSNPQPPPSYNKLMWSGLCWQLQELANRVANWRAHQAATLSLQRMLLLVLGPQESCFCAGRCSASRRRCCKADPSQKCSTVSTRATQRTGQLWRVQCHAGRSQHHC